MSLFTQSVGASNAFSTSLQESRRRSWNFGSFQISGGILSGPIFFFLERGLVIFSSSFLVKLAVDILRFLATCMRGRLGVVLGASPRSFLKWFNQPSLRLAAEPPWTVTEGLSFLPEISFTAFHAAACWCRCVAVLPSRSLRRAKERLGAAMCTQHVHAANHALLHTPACSSSLRETMHSNSSLTVRSHVFPSASGTR